MWVYTQRTGSMYKPDKSLLTHGYSGNTIGLNNPDKQEMIGVGPIPRGEYTIGPAHAPIDHLGRLALPLYPAPMNAMHGRSGFFIHGDNPAMNHTASNGCIILGPAFRQAILSSNDFILVVVDEERNVCAAFESV